MWLLVCVCLVLFVFVVVYALNALWFDCVIYCCVFVVLCYVLLLLFAFICCIYFVCVCLCVCVVNVLCVWVACPVARLVAMRLRLLVKMCLVVTVWFYGCVARCA